MSKNQQTPEPPEWQWNEMQHVGTDFSDLAEVQLYDQRMAQFRDFDAEHRRVFDAVEPKPNESLIEIGCGTANLTIAAARLVERVYAYDISDQMLVYSHQKAADAGLTNVQFAKGGFLSCHEDGPPVDIVVTQFALHHLPDFWKMVTLRRIARMLKPGGRFYLTDIVFSFEMQDYPKELAAWPERLGDETRPRAVKHLRQEYSTLDWVMQRMLKRADLKIVRAEHDDAMTVHYLCELVCPLGEQEQRIELAVGDGDDRLVLRQIMPDDAAELFGVIDLNRQQLRRWLPWVDHVKGVADEMQFIRVARNSPPSERPLGFAIHSEGSVVGIISFLSTPSKSDSIEIGYWLDADAQGHGIITRSTEQLVRYAFDELGVNRVVIRAEVENRSSCAVPERLGFVQESVQRQGLLGTDGAYHDAAYYVMLKDDWKSNTANIH